MQAGAKREKWVLSAVLALAAVSIIPERDARAYRVRKTASGGDVRWSVLEVQVLVDDSVGADNVPALVEATQRAVEAWNAASSMRLVFDPKTSVRAVGANAHPGGIVVRWAGGSWDHDQKWLGYTALAFATSTGVAVSASVTINDASVHWTTLHDDENEKREAAARQLFDLPATVTHEMGHALGLDHSEIEAATMYASTRPGETKKRELNGDDISAVDSLYGAPSDPIEPEAAASTGCTTTPLGGGDAGLLFVAALSAALIARARRPEPR
jgi:matrixin